MSGWIQAAMQQNTIYVIYPPKKIHKIYVYKYKWVIMQLFSQDVTIFPKNIILENMKKPPSKLLIIGPFFSVTGPKPAQI